MRFYFEDEVNPTPEELRRWAYSGVGEPMEDFDVIIGDLHMLPTLMELVADPACANRKTLLNGMYCLVGHEDRSDPRLAKAVEAAAASGDAWLRTWGERAEDVLQSPQDFRRDDWCGWPGYRSRPDGG